MSKGTLSVWLAPADNTAAAARQYTFVETAPPFPGRNDNWDGEIFAIQGLQLGITQIQTDHEIFATVMAQTSSNYANACNAMNTGYDDCIMGLANTTITPASIPIWHRLHIAWDLTATPEPVIVVYTDDSLVGPAVYSLNWTQSYHPVFSAMDASSITKLNFFLQQLSDGFNLYGIQNTGGTYVGSVAEMWLDFGSFLDPRVEENRRLFQTDVAATGGFAVNLGPHGEYPTGSPPAFFFHESIRTWFWCNASTAGVEVDPNGFFRSSIPGPNDPLYTFTGMAYLPQWPPRMPPLLGNLPSNPLGGC